EGWLESVYPGAVLKSYKISDALDFHRAVEVELEVELPGYACASPGYLSMSSPGLKIIVDNTRQFNLILDLDDEERKTPTHLWVTRVVQLDEEIKLPSGLQLANPIDEATDESDIASFTQNVTVKSGRVINKSVYRQEERTVPKDKYTELIAAQELMKKQAETVWTFRGGKR
ncbi:hypothetical protein KKG05_06335, partial [bacterium]|nr:hypothetical protein [bacterium]